MTQKVKVNTGYNESTVCTQVLPSIVFFLAKLVISKKSGNCLLTEISIKHTKLKRFAAQVLP